MTVSLFSLLVLRLETMNNEQLISWITGALQFTNVEDLTLSEAKTLLRTIKDELGLRRDIPTISFPNKPIIPFGDLIGGKKDSAVGSKKNFTDAAQDYLKKFTNPSETPSPFGSGKVEYPETNDFISGPSVDYLRDKYPSGTGNAFFLKPDELPGFLKELENLGFKAEVQDLKSVIGNGKD